MQLARRISLLVAFFLLASGCERHPGVCVGVVAARPLRLHKARTLRGL
jgi:hypothetical protein